MNVDLFMNYTLQEEESNNNDTKIKISTNIRKSKSNISIDDVKKEITEFIKDMPSENVKNLEIYFYQNEDLVQAVSKY